MLRILVVDRDFSGAESLSLCLQRHGYGTQVVDTGSAALKCCDGVELVLLELDLADVDGLDVCREIRRRSNIPIIAVTTRTTEVDRVLGLQAGADDYLVKPYGFRELKARIDAVMRRVNPRQTHRHVISRGPLHVDAVAREVHVNGRLVSVTRKEFDFLYLLASRPDEVITRKHIMRKVWDYDCVTPSRTIDTHVSTLRTKLGDSSWIVTVRGIGFRLGSGPLAVG